MLACLCAAASFVPGAPYPAAPAAPRPLRSVSMAAADEFSVLQRLSESFWEQKKTRMNAEYEMRMAELEEFEAREKALASTVGGGALPQTAQTAALEAELEQQRARVAALEAEVTQVRFDAEVNMQKVSAYWINKLALRPAEPAGALPAAADEPAPTPDLLPQESPLEADLSLRELRSRLIRCARAVGLRPGGGSTPGVDTLNTLSHAPAHRSYGLSTAGIKSELRKRLEQAMYDHRQQHRSWDPAALKWV